MHRTAPLLSAPQRASSGVTARPSGGCAPMRRRLLMIGLTSLSLLLVSTGSALASGTQRQVVMFDACDGPSFNAVLGPGACVRNGGLTFEKVIGQLASMGRAPAWRFSAGQVKLPVGGSIVAPNKGGEAHTFTEVANFGGGCVDELNAILGLTPVPECGNPAHVFGETLAGPGGAVDTGALGAGTHRFECLIHPWMRTTVTVG